MKIEKGIAIPKPLLGRKNSPVGEALSKMVPGDSIFIKLEHCGDRGERNAVTSLAAYYFGAGNYTTRKLKDGIRIWRKK